MISLFLFFFFFLNNCMDVSVLINTHTTKLNQTSSQLILNFKSSFPFRIFLLISERWTVIKMRDLIIYLAFRNDSSMIAILSVTLRFFHTSRLWANPQYFAISVMGERIEERRWRPREAEEVHSMGCMWPAVLRWESGGGILYSWNRGSFVDGVNVGYSNHSLPHPAQLVSDPCKGQTLLLRPGCFSRE